MLANLSLGSLALVLLFFTYQYVVLPAFISPLSRIPAAHPFCHITWRWLRRQQRQHRELNTLYAAHQRHGPLVRLGPNEVSVASPEGLRLVYIAGLEKTEWYAGEFMNYGTPNLVSMMHHAPHSRQKRMISGVYAKSYIQRSVAFRTLSESIMLDRFVPLLEKLSAEKRPINVLEMAQWAGMDFMTGYIFGLQGSTNFLQDAQSREKYFGPAGDKQYRESVCLEMCERAAEGLSRGNEDAVVFSRLFSQIQAASGQGPKPNHQATLLRCASEVFDHMLAGHETSGITVTYILWHLSADRKLQQRLKAEIQSYGLYSQTPEQHTTDSAEAPKIPTPTAIDGLPLLSAIVQETLRLHAAAPSRQPRVVPAGGIECHGSHIPAGTTISSNAYTLHRNAEAFPEPERWRPERWMSLGATARDTLSNKISPLGNEQMRRHFWPFSSGGRMCIGSHFAEQVIKTLVAAIYSSFETFIVDDEGIEQSDTYISGPIGQKLILRFEKAEPV